MAGKSKEIYDYIFGIYSINGTPLIDTKEKKEKARKLIRRRYSQEFGKKDWNSLTGYEKLKFTCIDIKEKMLDYINHSYADKMENKINRLVSESMLEAEALAEEYNYYLREAFDSYKASDPDDVKEVGYRKFCETVKALSNDIELPSKDEWFSSPCRAYAWINWSRDQRMEQYYEQDYEQDSQTIPVTDSEVDHIIIKMLLKERENKIPNNRAIDTEAIKECLSVQKNSTRGDEWDDISAEEVNASMRLKKLDFYLD